jgi:hypothetical protein
VILIVIGGVGVVGLLLAARDRGHDLGGGICVAERARFAKDAILYSLDSMTTRVASGLMLEPQRQMMGALEAANGVLLFGISTAYIFAVLQLYWPMLSDLLMTRRPHNESTSCVAPLSGICVKTT